MQGAAGAHALEFQLDGLDALGDAPPVGFQLRFARAAGADAAALPRHLDAVAGQARQHVVELRQFHLKPPFPCTGARSEDIQDELRPVDDLGGQRLFEIALLGGTEVLIEDDDVGVAAFYGGSEFVHLAAADQCGGFRSGARLHDALDDERAGTTGQFGQFLQGLLGL